MSSFYLYLPSNGSQKYFPKNTITKYTTKLPYTLKPNFCNYEVALTEVSYVCSFKTLSQPSDGEIHVTIPKGDSKSFLKLNIPMGHYQTIEYLVETINSHPENKPLLNLRYSSTKNRIALTVQIPDSSIEISEKLSYILGFNGKTDFSDKTTFAETKPDLKGGRNHIFIYSDIIEHQIVGSSFIPLFRIVNLTGSENEIVNVAFQKPYYLPVSRNEIDSISVILCDEFGEELPLNKGQVTLVLHFRKRDGV